MSIFAPVRRRLRGQLVGHRKEVIEVLAEVEIVDVRGGEIAVEALHAAQMAAERTDTVVFDVVVHNMVVVDAEGVVVKVHAHFVVGSGR